MSEVLALRLLPAESARLAELEAVIERGLTTFVEVGSALEEIRDSRLYRENFASFDDYCGVRWAGTYLERRQNVDAQIREAKVGSLLGGNEISLLNRAQARELAPLLAEPDALRETWAEVRELHPQPTAENVREVVQRRLGPGILGSSESNDWYTPAEYVEAARRVLGVIDVDPASCEEANAVIRARLFFTEAEDGLSRHWRGRVFINPPYGRLCPLFMAKLCDEYRTGNVTEAIALVSAYSTETRWFQPLFAHPICFPDHRLRGWPAPTFGSAFVYLGRNEPAFVAEFAKYGPIVRRIA